MNNIKKGFSLVELLISLIVISCITAAFTPLITKKFSSSVFGFGGGGVTSPQVSTNCSSKFSTDCLLCTSSECLSCSKSCPEGQCQDASNCSCKECSNDYPNCIKFNSNGCILCKQGYRLVDYQCVECPNGKYSDTGKECEFCDAGYWPNASKTACEPCPTGYICNQDTQIKCNGTTIPKVEEVMGGLLGSSHVCAPCPAGYYCADGVATECPDGTYSEGNASQCRTCTNGQYATDDKTACTGCMDGHFCVDGQQTKCSDKWKFCTSCTPEKCTACEDRAMLSNGQCVEKLDNVLQIDNLLVTQFNMGDKSNLPIPSTVKILTAGDSSALCPNGKCCWQGATAGTCNSNNGGYNGCTRTVCNWAAAQEICAKFDLNGETWRLPTRSEMSNWDAYSIGQDVAGLQLCSNSTANQNIFAACQYTADCYSSAYNNCYPGRIWSSEYRANNNFNIYIQNLNQQTWTSTSMDMSYGASVRCVATPDDCPQGKYKDGSSCYECSSLFPNCATCTKNKCTSCINGYELSPYNPADNKCYEVIENAAPIYDTYVTKFNLGDKNNLPIPSSVTMLTAGSSGDACESGKCCWQGTTANGGTKTNGDYSGATRTICNWEAAREICAKLDLGGKNWRLPTRTELSKWKTYSTKRGAVGIQLCGISSTNDARCNTKSDCYGSYKKYCYPSYVWSDQNSDGGNFFYVYTYYLDGSTWTANDSFIGGYASSVRCVASLSDCPRGQYLNGTSCSYCSSKFSHCIACDSSKCSACEDGYNLHPYNNKCYKVIEDAVPLDNLYVTKFNMGDNGLPIAPTVSVASAGSSCTSGKCCWQGQTANTNYCQNANSSNNGGYSGCTRTVCNWYAAKDICDNYKAGGKTWRLPNYNEMTNWYKYTISLGAAGPQLCDDYTTVRIATQCNYKANCKGAKGNYCYPAYIWAQSQATTNAYYSYLYNNVWNYDGSSWDKNYAHSVRCVTEIDYNE